MRKYLFGVLLIIILLIWGAVFSFPDEKLHLVFCDVGQGDAILIIKGDKQVLIDGGSGERVLGCLAGHMPFWDRTIEAMVLTHPEADHLTGLISVVERYNINQFVANSLVNNRDLFWELRGQVAEKQIPAYSPKAGDRIKIGDLLFEVKFPQEKLGDEIVWREGAAETQVLSAQAYTGNFNQTAIVLRLVFGDFQALLTGDVGFEQEEKIESAAVDVLKVAHHGSKYSTSKEFLEKILPKLAVISVGKNSYGHPTPEVLERLKALGVTVRRTDLNGEVEIVSDGESWYTKEQ